MVVSPKRKIPVFNNLTNLEVVPSKIEMPPDNQIDSSICFKPVSTIPSSESHTLPSPTGSIKKIWEIVLFKLKQ